MMDPRLSFGLSEDPRKNDHFWSVRLEFSLVIWGVLVNTFIKCSDICENYCRCRTDPRASENMMDPRLSFGLSEDPRKNDHFWSVRLEFSLVIWGVLVNNFMKCSDIHENHCRCRTDPRANENTMDPRLSFR